LIVLFQDHAVSAHRAKNGNDLDTTLVINHEICLPAVACALDISRIDFTYSPTVTSLDFDFSKLVLKVKAGLSGKKIYVSMESSLI